MKLYQTLEIMKFIDSKHPEPPIKSYGITESDKSHLMRLNGHSFARINVYGIYNYFNFIYHWSLQKDEPTSYIAIFFRPIMIHWFIISTLKWKSTFTHNFAEQHGQIEDKDAYYPKNTVIDGLKYFQNSYDNQQLLNRDKSKHPTFFEFQLFGMFQSIYCGLSDA